MWKFTVVLVVLGVVVFGGFELKESFATVHGAFNEDKEELTNVSLLALGSEENREEATSFDKTGEALSKEGDRLFSSIMNILLISVVVGGMLFFLFGGKSSQRYY